MTDGKKILGDIKFYDSYSKFNWDLGRKESWEEACKDVMKLHYNTFKNNKKLQSYIIEVEKDYIEQRILVSQRNLQYREAQINRSPARIFNCSSSYIDRPEVFKEAMWLLLNGCGK